MVKSVMEDDPELRLKVQDPTFTYSPGAEALSTKPQRESMVDKARQAGKDPPSSVTSVDIERLMSAKELTLDVSGTEAMALLYRMVESLISLSNRIEDGELSESVVVESIFNVWESKHLPAAFLEEAIGYSHRKNEMERMKIISKSQEELGVSLRKKSMIMSNFEEASGPEGGSPRLREYIAAEVGSYEPCCDEETRKWLSKKFYLKNAPNMEISAYIDRINRNLDISGAVALCAGWFLFKFVFNIRSMEKKIRDVPLVPHGGGTMERVSKRNAFRLILTSIRLASKLIEDKNYKQGYYCRVTGLQKTSDLFRLELAMGYGLEWGLFVNEKVLKRYLIHLDQLLLASANSEMGE